MTGNAKLSVLVLGTEHEVAEDVRRMVESLPKFAITSETADFYNGVKAVRECEPDVVLVITNGETRLVFAAIEEISRQAPQTAVFALSADDRPGTIIRTMRAGATEFLALPPDLTELAKALTKVTEIRQASAPIAAAGEVWTVLSPREGVGATTLTSNLGIELRTGLGKDVVLVDFDFRSAELALFLNLNPPSSLLDIALNFKRLDGVFLHSTLVRHPSGLYLLAAPGQATPELTRMPADQVAGLLDLLRASHEVIIIDAPPPLSETVLAAVARSQRVILPTELTVPCLRAAWRAIERIAALDTRPEHLDVVAVKHGVRTEITLAEARRTLKVPVNYHLPKDDDTAYTAINKGVPLAEVNGASPLRQAIVALARDLTAAHHDAQPRKGLFRMLF